MKILWANYFRIFFAGGGGMTSICVTTLSLYLYVHIHRYMSLPLSAKSTLLQGLIGASSGQSHCKPILYRLHLRERRTSSGNYARNSSHPTIGSCIEVPWTWEKESRGQKPKSLKKVAKKSPGPGSQKSEKTREKGPKTLQKPIFGLFFWLFGPFSRLFLGFWGPAPGDSFRDFFETFWLLAPRLLLPGPRNLNSCTKSALKIRFPVRDPETLLELHLRRRF